MGIIAVLLSGLLSVGLPMNFIIEQITTSRIQDRLENAEQLEIRVDNSPVHQALNGKLQKVRLASRGVQLTPELRIDTLELETDPINLNLAEIKGKKIKSIDQVLQQPLNAAVRLVLTETDLNNAFKSERIQSRLTESANRALGQRFPNRRYDFGASKLEFLPNNRLRLELDVKQYDRDDDENYQEVAVILESGIEAISGTRFRFVDPTGSINGRNLSRSLLNRFAEGFSDRLDLETLEKQGIYLRVLQWNIEDDRLALAAFVRLNDD
jgi:hypothetical protein